jgi:hypothetical protein
VGVSHCWRVPGKVSGVWLFKGTVPVKTLFENLEDGAGMDDFLRWFPGVTREQVQCDGDDGPKPALSAEPFKSEARNSRFSGRDLAQTRTTQIEDLWLRMEPLSGLFAGWLRFPGLKPWAKFSSPFGAKGRPEHSLT